jgi:hypothetical protein
VGFGDLGDGDGGVLLQVHQEASGVLLLQVEILLL